MVCQKCKEPYTPSQTTLEAAGITPEMVKNASFARGRGCGSCHGSGYRGRLGIFELMLMSSKVRELTFHEATTEQLRRAGISEGMTTLYRDGIDKVCRGITTLEEVYRVSKRDDES